jgi:hypothetical protein
MALAIVAMMSGSVATAQTAYAAQSTNDTTVYTPPSAPRAPGVQHARLPRNDRQHGLRTRLDLARRLARLGLLSLLTTTDWGKPL